MEAGVSPPMEATTITVTLAPQELEILRQLAAERNLPEEVVMREAIIEKKFFADHRRNGQKIVIQYPDGKLSPVNWAY